MRHWILVAFLFLAACKGSKTRVLEVKESQISVSGKTAKIYSVPPLVFKQGEKFDVILKNQIKTPTSIHWHGLILPNNQDGVAFITQYPIYPDGSYRYSFPLTQAGTFWMHSHYSFQEQDQLSAPLILQSSEDEQIADQEVVLLLSDFSFKSPEEIFYGLQHPSMGMKMSGSDLVDVDYDALLTNLRTLDNPDVIRVEKNKRIRLRIINGASATNFFIFLGDLKAEAIAVDGNRICPLRGSCFELAAAQRLDIRITISDQEGAFPIIAQGEGTDLQTGLILATKSAAIPKLSPKAQGKIGALTNVWEDQFHPLNPLTKKPIDRRLLVELGGNMAKYIWTINGQAWPNVTPLIVKEKERVEMTFKNTTMMSHPMHLHGHVFQVTALNGIPIDGPMRDTVLVPAHSTITIQFDANQPGVWPLHCHLLYHRQAGMMTVLRYQNFTQPL